MAYSMKLALVCLLGLVPPVAAQDFDYQGLVYPTCAHHLGTIYAMCPGSPGMPDTPIERWGIGPEGAAQALVNCNHAATDWKRWAHCTVPGDSPTCAKFNSTVYALCEGVWGDGIPVARWGIGSEGEAQATTNCNYAATNANLNGGFGKWGKCGSTTMQTGKGNPPSLAAGHFAEDTHDWDNEKVSTKGAWNADDATAHSTELTNALSAQYRHGADDRDDATVYTALGSHDRHHHLRQHNPANSTMCTGVQCTHVQRTYAGITTSSIVVSHVCQKGAPATPEFSFAAWPNGNRFETANTGEMLCTEENTPDCKTGHVCGNVRMPDGTFRCECHGLGGTFQTRADSQYTDIRYLPTANTLHDGQ